MEEAERIVYENYIDLLDSVFDEILQKFEAPSRIEPVVVHRAYSHENLTSSANFRLEKGVWQQLPQTESDFSYDPSTKIIKRQLLSLERKNSSSTVKGFFSDEIYKGSPQNSLASKFIGTDSDAEDDPWPWLPDCKSQSSSQE